MTAGREVGAADKQKPPDWARVWVAWVTERDFVFYFKGFARSRIGLLPV